MIELLNIMTKSYNSFLLLIEIAIGKSGARDDLISSSILYWIVQFFNHSHKQELIAVSDRKVRHANADKEQKKRTKRRQVWAGRDFRSADYNEITLLPV